MADPTYKAAQPGEFFCPAGGRWYMCETGTKFIGCCMADPCVNGCHGDSLRPAGRSTALDSQSPGGSCGGQTPFWTCEQAPTFWGCCNEDPCMNNSTCPDTKLEPTYWDRPDQYEYFKDLNILLSSTAPRSTSSASSTAASNSGASNRKAIIRGAVGGTLGFLLLIGIVTFLLWRRKTRRRLDEQEETEPEAGELAPPIAAVSSPPTYYSTRSPFSPALAGIATSPGSSPHHDLHGEVPSDDKDMRAAYTELHSKSEITRVAELPGAPAAGELATPDATPRARQGGFGEKGRM